MTGSQAIEALKQWGYQFALKEDGRITATLPGGLHAPDAVEALLEDIRKDRDGAVFFLKALQEGALVTPNETQLFQSNDLTDFLALLLEVSTDKITLAGDICYHVDTGMIETFWRSKEPLAFYRPGLSGSDLRSLISERLAELFQEEKRGLPIEQSPFFLVERVFLENILTTAQLSDK